MITVDILRHGELEGGVKYRGWVDDPLTNSGRASMDAVWRELRNEIDLIISSPLSRCLQPARDWAREREIKCKTDSRIAEMHYGAWEGLTAQEIMAQFPDQLERWRANPEGMSAPGGESVEQLRDRVVDFCSEICKKHDGKRVLLVMHSGSMRMLLAHTLNAPIATTRSMQMPYSCWSRAVFQDAGSELIFHNRNVKQVYG